jgi:hypothetical protein
VSPKWRWNPLGFTGGLFNVLEDDERALVLVNSHDMRAVHVALVTANSAALRLEKP